MESSMEDKSRNTALVGISGASSSGKTTLCRLLKEIFPNTFVIHQDDFFKPEEEIPNEGEFKDWDCVDALYMSDFVGSLEYIRQNGYSAKNPHACSIENQKTDSEWPISESIVATLKNKVNKWSSQGQPGHILHRKKLYLVEGFLMYSQSTSALWPYLDLKIFLQISFSAMKTRREARNANAGHEYVWTDPPNYIDRKVWPNYCRDHEWLFEDGNVEGNLLEIPDSKCKIISLHGIDMDLETTLSRIVDLLMRELPIIFKS